MKEKPYEVKVFLQQRYLRLRAAGFWSLATARAYQKEMYEGFRKLEKGGAWKVLSDRRKMVPQNHEVQAIISQTMRKATECGLTHTAFIVDSALAEHQIQRLGANKLLSIKMFHDEKDALHWLLHET